MDVSYYSADSETASRRVIHPYSILAHSHHWYVAAHDEKRGEVRLFRGDRLLSVRKTAERFERPGDFDARRFFASRVRSDKAPAMTVEVLFKPEYARFIAERFPSGAIKKRSDGSAVVTMKVDNISWAARWVLKHGTYARALYPKELVDEVKKRCDEMCALYE
jgi:proteasome accessory factor B